MNDESINENDDDNGGYDNVSNELPVRAKRVKRSEIDHDVKYRLLFDDDYLDQEKNSKNSSEYFEDDIDDETYHQSSYKPIDSEINYVGKNETDSSSSNNNNNVNTLPLNNPNRNDVKTKSSIINDNKNYHDLLSTTTILNNPYDTIITTNSNNFTDTLPSAPPAYEDLNKMLHSLVETTNINNDEQNNKGDGKLLTARTTNNDSESNNKNDNFTSAKDGGHITSVRPKDASSTMATTAISSSNSDAEITTMNTAVDDPISTPHNMTDISQKQQQQQPPTYSNTIANAKAILDVKKDLIMKAKNQIKRKK